MLPLDVPLIPGREYTRFLALHRDRLRSIHFSLSDPAMSDARQRMTQPNLVPILSALNELPDLPKYVLANARLHAPDKYFSADFLDFAGELLAELLDKAAISGLVFADFYHLQALSDAHPDIATKLEAVPSINTMPDSAERVFAILDMIASTAFNLPSHLILDRSLNRDMNRLEETAVRIRATYPDMKLYLIANEGCLYQCPFKPAHDAHIAIVNEGLCGERTFAMNRDFGCVRHMLSDPGIMLASPFIRPEDMARYEGLVDGIKLCGRNRGTGFLTRVIGAYLDGGYDGNLLDLMDAMGDLADRLDLPNRRLPDSFFNRATSCDKNCRACGWCASLAERIVTRLDPGLG